MLAELEVVEQIFRARQWKEYFEQLRLLANQGEMKAAADFARQLQRYYPEEYGKAEDEIKVLIQAE